DSVGIHLAQHQRHRSRRVGGVSCVRHSLRRLRRERERLSTGALRWFLPVLRGPRLRVRL
ncbi:MAG: hypothetical protein ACK53Y_28430, partial [bacterium]